MGWFNYLKASESLGVSEPNTNYSYPYLKRYIKKFKPLDTISQDSWVYVDITDLDIDKFYNSSLEQNTDETSYIVVYEDPMSDVDFTPVKCVINGSYMYFQTAEQHVGNTEIDKQYAIYYKTPNLRYIKSVENSTQQDYQVTTSELAEFNSDFSEVNLESFEVTLSSNTYYNFSFFNEWNTGLAKDYSSYLNLTFTGPNIYVYGGKGLDFGKFKYRIISLKDSKNLLNYTEVDWTVVDCYSSENSNNELLIEVEGLSNKDYILELHVLSEKNVLSSGSKIYINRYGFTYNLYMEVDGEQITENAAFVSIGGIR